MSSNKPGSPGHATDADAARVVDGDSHYDNSDMDRAVKDAEHSHGAHPEDGTTTEKRVPPNPPKP